MQLGNSNYAGCEGYVILFLFFSVLLTRCGPCKKIAPKFASLSEKYSDVVFVKVDVDICRVGARVSRALCMNCPAFWQNTAKRYEVSAMPTFLFFKNREKLEGQVLNILLIAYVCAFF